MILSKCNAFRGFINRQFPVGAIALLLLAFHLIAAKFDSELSLGS